MKNFFICIIALLVPTTLLAQEGAAQGTLLSSPKCDGVKVQSLAGAALRNIRPAPWEGTFYIELDESALSYQELSRRMVEADCY